MSLLLHASSPSSSHQHFLELKLPSSWMQDLCICHMPTLSSTVSTALHTRCRYCTCWSFGVLTETEKGKSWIHQNPFSPPPHHAVTSGMSILLSMFQFLIYSNSFATASKVVAGLVIFPFLHAFLPFLSANISRRGIPAMIKTAADAKRHRLLTLS